MTSARTTLLAVAMAAIMPVAVPASAQRAMGAACPSDGDLGAAALHRSWILEGWNRAPGDGPFSFRKQLGRYYDWDSPDVVLFDDFDPQRRVARSAAAYASIWEPIFSATRSARHAVSDEPSVTANSGELTASALEFVARIEGGDGKVTAIRTRSDLVWRCRDAQWRIVREHNSTRVVPVAEVDALVAGR